MTPKQLDEIVGYLIRIVLPPSVADDPPIVAEQVLEILECHCDAIRGTIIHHRQDDDVRQKR